MKNLGLIFLHLHANFNIQPKIKKNYESVFCFYIEISNKKISPLITESVLIIISVIYQATTTNY